MPPLSFLLVVFSLVCFDREAWWYNREVQKYVWLLRTRLLVIPPNVYQGLSVWSFHVLPVPAQVLWAIQLLPETKKHVFRSINDSLFYIFRVMLIWRLCLWHIVLRFWCMSNSMLRLYSRCHSYICFRLQPACSSLALIRSMWQITGTCSDVFGALHTLRDFRR